MKSLIESIADKDYESANEIIGERLDTIVEMVLLAKKRELGNSFVKEETLEEKAKWRDPKWGVRVPNPSYDDDDPDGSSGKWKAKSDTATPYYSINRRKGVELTKKGKPTAKSISRLKAYIQTAKNVKEEKDNPPWDKDTPNKTGWKNPHRHAKQLARAEMKKRVEALKKKKEQK